MLDLNMMIMVLISATMVVALFRIRSCLIKSGFQDRLSHFKLIIHALAFLLYIVVLVIATSINDFSNEYYFHWFITLIFGVAAFTCLFIMLYHLGEKQKVPRISTTRDTTSTTFKDFSYQESPEDFGKPALIIASHSPSH